MTYHDNMTCKVCGTKFHWCTSCRCCSQKDYARDEGFCSVECAVKSNPDWWDHWEGYEGEEEDDDE